MRESIFQSRLIQKLNKMLPGCIILKNDSSLKPGIPDLLILFNDMWAALEVKASATAKEQPNQRYYLELMDSMSYAAIIHPGNEEEILDDLQHTFGIDW